MNWRDVRECYGRGYEQYLKHLLSLFPQNGHWRRVSDLVRDVSPKYDLLSALDLLSHHGEITIDESCVSITKYRLGGEAIEVIEPGRYNHIPIMRSREAKMPDMVKR